MVLIVISGYVPMGYVYERGCVQGYMYRQYSNRIMRGYVLNKKVMPRRIVSD